MNLNVAVDFLAPSWLLYRWIHRCHGACVIGGFGGEFATHRLGMHNSTASASHLSAVALAQTAKEGRRCMLHSEGQREEN